MPLESRVDVLIIGAGPAGLMCATALAMAGVDVRIIDKRPAKVAVGQADGIQPRTIEVLQSYGLAERLVREGNQTHVMASYIPDRNGGIECSRRFPGITPPNSARYPFWITRHQGAVEDIFLDSMKDNGMQVEFSRQPVAIEILEDTDELSSLSSYPVKVTVERLDAVDQSKTEILHAKFVIDADGAHSWVRKALAITMEGEQTDYIWGVVDMIPETNFPDIRVCTTIHSDNGSSLIIPREGDLVRFYVQLSNADVTDQLTGRVEKSKVTQEKLVSVARKILHPFELADPKVIEWWTIYTIGQRVASSYSVKDRIFIAGDACHTHSPKAGQGMNAGINDTHNLAWKLAQVLRGWSKPLLLETYEQERRGFAQDLINFDKKFAFLFSGKPGKDNNEGSMSWEQLFQASQAYGKLISGVGVRYSPSVVVDPKHQNCASNLVVGERMPFETFVRAADIRPVEIQDLLPADVRFKILFFVGNMTEARVIELKELAGELSKPSSFLQKYSPSGNITTVFDIITIAAGKKEDINYLCVPAFFRPHWSKVLLDDTDVTGSKGGQGYKKFGIDPERVTLVIVRPDGFVGSVVPSSAIGDLDNYFGSFMHPRDFVA